MTERTDERRFTGADQPHIDDEPAPGAGPGGLMALMVDAWAALPLEAAERVVGGACAAEVVTRPVVDVPAQRRPPVAARSVAALEPAAAARGRGA